MKHFSSPILLAALLVSAAGTACSPAPTVVTTQAPALGAPVRGITVEGFGDASGQPNIARVTVGVESRAPTADAAISQANVQMGQVIAALKTAGVAPADIRTTNVAVHFERFSEPPPRPVEEAPAPPKGPKGKPVPTPGPAPAPPAPPQFKGMYRASNMVEVTIRKLDQAGQVLSAATSSGANQMFGIQFEIEDPTSLEQQARGEAFADAKKKAERLAELAGVRLGAPQSITEVGQGGGPMRAQAMMMRSEASDVPVERGELKVTSTVQVVFGIGQ